MIGQHTGASYTSDLSADGIAHLVKSAIELAGLIRRKKIGKGFGSGDNPLPGLPVPNIRFSIETDCPNSGLIR